MSREGWPKWLLRSRVPVARIAETTTSIRETGPPTAPMTSSPTLDSIDREKRAPVNFSNATGILRAPIYACYARRLSRRNSKAVEERFTASWITRKLLLHRNTTPLSFEYCLQSFEALLVEKGPADDKARF